MLDVPQTAAQARLEDCPALREAIKRYRPHSQELYCLWTVPNVSLYNITEGAGRTSLIGFLQACEKQGRLISIVPLERVFRR
jgi:hypothetical protein